MTTAEPVCHLHQPFQPKAPFIISSAPPALLFISSSHVHKVRIFMQWISQLEIPDPEDDMPSARKLMKHLSSDILFGMQLFLEALTQMELADDKFQAIFHGLTYHCANPCNLNHAFKVRMVTSASEGKPKPYERALREVCGRVINTADSQTTCEHKVYPTMPALRALQAVVHSLEVQ